MKNFLRGCTLAAVASFACTGSYAGDLSGEKPLFSYFQQQTISGIVKDSTGAPLQGVSVAVKGSPLTTVTGAGGAFRIAADDNATLVFSMIGFAPREEQVNGRNNLTITLQPDAAKLNEVVVTAIGIKQQKRKLGYATQEVNTDVLAESKTLNIGSALSGQVAGLTVTNPTGLFQTPGFSLRGKSPLIVIDGVPVETDFYDVSGEDIANINVLKGTTAAALYGSRGKNGAILITTKKASKSGWNFNVGTNNMVTAGFTVFPETQTEYGNGSNGKYEFWDGSDGGISDGDMIWGPKFGTGIKVAQWNSPIRNKQTGEEIPWWGDVRGTVYNDKSKYERVPIDWVRHDNLNDFLRTGLVTENTFSAAYKGEKGQFYFSGKQAYQRGQVPNTSLNTGGLTFNASYELAKNVTIDAGLSYNKVFSPNYPRYGYGPKNHMYTILIWMGDDVNGKELKEHMYVPGMEGYRQANYNYAWYNNPYFASYELEQKQNRNTLNGQLKLAWEVMPDLTLQVRGNARERSSFEDMKSPKSYMNYGDSRNGDYKMWNRSQLNLDGDFLAAYNKEISDNIQFGINAGASTFYRNYQEEYASSDGLIVPFVYSLNNTQGPVQATNYLEEKAINSIYASANLDLYRAVYLNFSARNDWSSTLPSKNNSYFYPSVSLSTIVSEYLNLPSAVDYLKLSGSWAEVSSDLSPYSIASTYYKGVTYGSTPSVYYPASLINPDIKPEKSTSYEFGLATSFLKNRFSVEATYYNIVDENQIIDLSVSEASGFNSRKVNGNQYTTNGFEVVAGIKPILQKNFSWNMGLNWSRSVRKLTEIYNNQAKYGNFVVGDRADAYYSTVWQKSATGEVILDGNTGLPIKDPFVKNVGNLDPNWRLGMQNSFKIGNFTVNLDIDGAWGGLLRSVTIEKMWWGGKHPSSVEYRDAEYAAGQPVYVPQGVIVTGGTLQRDVNGNVISDTRTYKPNTRAVNWQTWSQVYPYQARVTEQESEKFANIFDRSYFKLRRLSIGYDLTKLVKLGSLKGVDLSLYGYNLLMWKKVPYLDPDYGNDDNLQDPSARYVGFSINVKL
ncbi:SusC/RagA family TonB-linked outer membrane protein [Parasegetibacter sp. NRK P23]|uniref:SusC/RagA family TonB-linked outer membrane protein n=1 Tax=Parasegetibacter sp. NRK P23 TaxID=2942999 RepID=UPI002043FE2C|nr:SusC/RagA family TonB-linked outer membrane protein [Parasegetibacter sp. NRK P23]MCM5527675.1 SusC/RagA family TonB-linked outer membrane protein [Parasegetibacter sp. NRK P23]